MTDYSKTVIYKIQHLDKDELLYVGHTTNFTKRKCLHKHNCKTKTSPLYKMMRENGGWECFNMIVIKDFPCANRTEACLEEDKVMRAMKANMNTLRAYTTPEEKYGQRKEYNQANKEVINEKHKVYYQANKEQIIESKKKYRQANIELISEKAKEKTNCECGCIVTKLFLARHKKNNETS